MSNGRLCYMLKITPDCQAALSPLCLGPWWAWKWRGHAMWTVGGEFLPVCALIQGHVRKGTHHYGQEMGGGRSPRVGENICSVREGVSACVRMCHSIPVCTCAWVIIHNTVGGVTVIRRKETIHWKPLLSTPPPTELLLIPTAGFLSEAPARGWPSKRWYNRVCAPQTNREVRWASQGENRAYTHKQA